MKVLIFEGIATSGKSTVINGLISNLPTSLKVVMASEEKTHIPIMDRRDELHIEFFKHLISQLAGGKPDVIIFDRLYMTQAFRSQSTITDYEEIENLLSQYETGTVFLRVAEAAIADRIRKAAEHRESEWEAYIKTRGQTLEEIAQYYITQQRSQLQLLEQSKLPYKIFDTTTHDYQPIIEEISDL